MPDHYLSEMVAKPQMVDTMQTIAQAVLAGWKLGRWEPAVPPHPHFPEPPPDLPSFPQVHPKDYELGHLVDAENAEVINSVLRAVLTEYCAIVPITVRNRAFELRDQERLGIGHFVDLLLSIDGGKEEGSNGRQ